MDSNPNTRPITLQCALELVPALAAQQSAMAGFMKENIQAQVRDWYAQGVSVQVDITKPLGKQLVQQGWVKL